MGPSLRPAGEACISEICLAGLCLTEEAAEACGQGFTAALRVVSDLCALSSQQPARRSTYSRPWGEQLEPIVLMNAAPIGIADGYSVHQGQQFHVAPAAGVLSNDYDTDAGDALAAALQ